jgi:chemotaxis protein histidine kinase CheA
MSEGADSAKTGEAADGEQAVAEAPTEGAAGTAPQDQSWLCFGSGVMTSFTPTTAGEYAKEAARAKKKVEDAQRRLKEVERRKLSAKYTREEQKREEAYLRKREKELQKEAEEAERKAAEKAEREAIEAVEEGVRTEARKAEREEAEAMAATYFKRREVEGAPAPQQMARDPPPQISRKVAAEAWAAKWWEVYQAEQMAEPDKAGRESYNDQMSTQMSTQPEAFYALLEPRAEGTPATVALLRGSYVLRLADKLRQCKTDEERAALRLGRRHEMAADAFLTAAQVRALRRGPGGECCETCDPTPEMLQDRPLRLVSFTHDGHAGTKGHPDPYGQELVRFANQVRYERRCCDQIVACCPANGEPDPTATRTAPVKDLSQYACCWVLEFALCQSLFCGCDSNEGYCCGLPCYGQRCGESKVAFPSGEFAVFYEYSSLHHDEAANVRTPDEAAAGFVDRVSALTHIQRLATMYVMEGVASRPRAAARATATAAATAALAPGGVKKAAANPPTTTVLGEHLADHPRGELLLANLVRKLLRPGFGEGRRGWRVVATPNLTRRETSWVESRPECGPRGDWSWSRWNVSGCNTNFVPRHPQDVAASLARKTFPEGADWEVAARLYAGMYAGFDTFTTASHSLRGLWASPSSDDDAVTFAQTVLPLMTQVETLDVGQNRLGSRGMDALEKAIREGAAPRLKRLVFGDNIDMDDKVDGWPVRDVVTQR